MAKQIRKCTQKEPSLLCLKNLTMVKKLANAKKSNRKVIIIAITIIIILVLLVVINNCRLNSLVYIKIKGWSTVDLRFSRAERNGISYALYGNFNFQNGKVKLPYSVYDLKKNKMQSLNRQMKEYGNWKFISRNPDSILIEDSKDFFSGKYGVEFGIAKSDPIEHQPDTLWVLLSNDSTHIVLNKLSSLVRNELYQKWLE